MEKILLIAISPITPFIIILYRAIKSLLKKGFNNKQSFLIFTTSLIPNLFFPGLIIANHKRHPTFAEGIGEAAFTLLAIFVSLTWILCLENYRYKTISPKHVFASIFSAITTLTAFFLLFFLQLDDLLKEMLLQEYRYSLPSFCSMDTITFVIITPWVLLLAIPFHWIGLKISSIPDYVSLKRLK